MTRARSLIVWGILAGCAAFPLACDDSEPSGADDLDAAPERDAATSSDSSSGTDVVSRGDGAITPDAAPESDGSVVDGSSVDATVPPADADAPDAVIREAASPDAFVATDDAGPVDAATCSLSALAGNASLQLPANRTTLTATVSGTRAIAWTQRSGPSTAKAYDIDRATATVVGLKQGTYVFRATAAGCGSADVTVRVTAAAAQPMTALEQVRWTASPYPRPSTLPPLVQHICPTMTTQAGFDFETVLAEKYGYAYHLHQADSYWTGLMSNASSDIAKKIAKNRSNPQVYKLATTVSRPTYTWDTEGRNGASRPTYFGTLLPARCSGCSPAIVTAASNVASNSMVFSPAADTRWWDLMGQDAAAGFTTYKNASVPISVALNLGEDGSGISQGSCANGAWTGDAAIAAHIKTVLGVTAVPPCNDRRWAEYASKQIARTQQAVTDRVTAAGTSGMLYVRYRTEGNLNRDRYGGWSDWAPFYEDTKRTSTLPSMSIYYDGAEPPYFRWTDSRSSASYDMLTGVLASVSLQIAEGYPLSYNWVSGGWPEGSNTLSPIDRYTGFLKVLYATGNLGAIATWWAATQPFAASCNPSATLTEYPNALQQMVQLGEVHALYTYLEPYLRDGDLLPGPAKHVWTKTLAAAKQRPAYELNCTAAGCDRTVRVVGRKRKSTNDWLLVAWAAGGNDTDVTVAVPTLGSVTLRARAAGTVYTARAGAGGPALTLLDEDAMHPTDTLVP